MRDLWPTSHGRNAELGLPALAQRDEALIARAEQLMFELGCAGIVDLVQTNFQRRMSWVISSLKRERAVGVVCYSEGKHCANCLPVDDGDVQKHEHHFAGLLAADHGDHQQYLLTQLNQNEVAPEKCSVYLVSKHPSFLTRALLILRCEQLNRLQLSAQIVACSPHGLG